MSILPANALKISYVHDWLVSLGGAEDCLSEMLKVFPAPIKTLLANKEKLRGSSFEGLDIDTSFIQKLPWAKKKYRSYLPLFPMAIEQFDLSSADLVISSSHCVAKGALTHSDQYHICYCHTPVRYGWDFYHESLRSAGLKQGVKGVFAKLFLHYLRMWDVQSTPRVDLFIANSKYVAARIKKTYNREAIVMYPPVDTEFFSFKEKKESFYLTASRLVPYKKIDLIINAFNKMPEKRLVVIGDGPEMQKLRRQGKSNIELMGFVSKKVLREKMQKAKGFVFAACEDFGIAPLQAQSCGTPVICFGKGGSLETVVDGQTGVFFDDQSEESLVQAVETFEKRTFDPKIIRQHAEKFSKERFRKEFEETVLNNYNAFRENFRR